MTGEPTVDSAVRAAAARLLDAGVASALNDAELLASHVLGVERAELARLRASGRTLTVPQSSALVDLVHERARRLPLQHLTGHAHLRLVSVDVGPGVFVPRPETEVTVDQALAAVRRAGAGREKVRVVDLCTGSAVIAVALVAEARALGLDVSVVGVEKSPDALAWARRNADKYGHGVIEIREGDATDCAEDVCADLAGRCHVVVSNPPYIPDAAQPVDPEARDHDPRLALFGGPDGLNVVRGVATSAGQLLRPGGTVVVEHGEAQGGAVREILTAAGFVEAGTRQDLTGRDRVAVATLPS